MMKTLDEYIQYCEEVAKRKQQEGFFRNTRANAPTVEGSKCYECAAHYRQLVELLRELKKLREIPEKLVPKYRDGTPDEYNRGANEMLEEVIDDIRKYIAEVNADET